MYYYYTIWCFTHGRCVRREDWFYTRFYATAFQPRFDTQGEKCYTQGVDTEKHYEGYPDSHPANQGGWERRYWLTVVAVNSVYAKRLVLPGRVTMAGLRVIPKDCFQCEGPLLGDDAHAVFLQPLRNGGNTIDTNIGWAHLVCAKKYRRKARRDGFRQQTERLKESYEWLASKLAARKA